MPDTPRSSASQRELACLLLFTYRHNRIGYTQFELFMQRLHCGDSRRIKETAEFFSLSSNVAGKLRYIEVDSASLHLRA